MMGEGEWVSVWWTDKAIDAAIRAQKRRLASLAGCIVHPEVYVEAERWAMTDAIKAAQKVQENL